MFTPRSGGFNHREHRERREGMGSRAEPTQPYVPCFLRRFSVITVSSVVNPPGFGPLPGFSPPITKFTEGRRGMRDRGANLACAAGEDSVVRH